MANGWDVWPNLRQFPWPLATAFLDWLKYTGAIKQSRGNWLRVYVDGVMGLNFLVDLLLLLGTNRLTGFPSDWKRLTAAALLGAVYSGVCLLPDFRFLGSEIWRLVFLGLMGVMAFGWNRSAVKRSGVFLFLSLALGGLAVSVGRSDIRALALAGGGLWLLGRLSFDAASDREYLPLEIQNGDRTVKLLALRDTGNTLRDPVTGEAVLVIAADAAARLTGLTARQLKDPLGTMAEHAIPGLRLIPFRTIGQNTGMMLAMTVDRVVLDGKTRKTLIAFAPENFGGGAVYQALTGGAF